VDFVSELRAAWAKQITDKKIDLAMEVSAKPDNVYMG
jgi:hypothetical protein